jgi:MoxR-like ATPase
LVLAAKAHALLAGRFHLAPDDLRRVAAPVLRHRILVNFHAQAEGIGADAVVDRLIELVQAPASGL